MSEKQPAVYIIANKRNGTLYVGVSGNLPARMWSHRQGQIEGFAKRHGLNLLVYYEMHRGISEAILREKQIKAWKREWKIRMIEKMNPYWRDLSGDIAG